MRVYSEWHRLFSGDESLESVTAKFQTLYGHAPEYAEQGDDGLWRAGPVKVVIQETQQQEVEA